MNSKKTLLILAGGLGSRYKGLKQIDGILDNSSPILEYSIYDALEAGFNKMVIIINRAIPKSYMDRIEHISNLKNFELHWVYQDLEKYVPESYHFENRQKPWGTAHAILCAKDIIHEAFAMINADDFYGKKTYHLAGQEIKKGNISEHQFEMIAYPVETTLSDNGNVARGICTIHSDDFLVKVEEQTSIRKKNDLIIYTTNEKDIILPSDTLVSMNFFIFHPNIFTYLESYFTEFLNLNPTITEEFYIPFVVQKMIDAKIIKVKVKTSPSTWKGVTYPEDKNTLKAYLKDEIKNGIYPRDLWS